MHQINCTFSIPVSRNIWGLEYTCDPVIQFIIPQISYQLSFQSLVVQNRQDGKIVGCSLGNKHVSLKEVNPDQSPPNYTELRCKFINYFDLNFTCSLVKSGGFIVGVAIALL